MSASSVFKFPIVLFSQGTPLSGVIHRNVNNLVDPQPAVIITGSWLTVKEQMPATYAKSLVPLGYTVLTFDFTGFGQSGGKPRQAEIPERKIADIAAAADFLSTLSCVRKGAIGHLGICASAQYVLSSLARGARIDSFVSVAGWYHDAASVAVFYGGKEGVGKRIERASNALRKFISSGEVETVPAYQPNDEEAGMFFELPYYALATRGAVAEWKNEMAALSWLYWLTLDGISAAAKVRQPTLLVHGDGCVFPENAKRVYDMLTGKKKKVWIDGNQVDFYDQPALVSKAVQAAHEHFSQTLAR